MKTLDEQIAEIERSANGLVKSAADYRQTAENLAREATEALSRAAELKAKRTAEALRAKRDAEASKTVGQRVAEQMVVAQPFDADYQETITIAGLYVEAPFTSAESALDCVRKDIAAAIDRADAKAREEEREACAKLAESSPFTVGKHIAADIRGRAK